MTKGEKVSNTVAELCINIGNGQAIVREDNEIEFEDCVPISISNLEYITKEAKKFIEYRNERNHQNDLTKYHIWSECPFIFRTGKY